MRSLTSRLALAGSVILPGKGLGDPLNQWLETVCDMPQYLDQWCSNVQNHILFCVVVQLVTLQSIFPYSL